jgi:hypothetical protein
VAVKPWEAASGDGKAVQCVGSQLTQCTASMSYSGPAGTFALHVRYFDQNSSMPVPGGRGGQPAASAAAKFRVLVAGKVVDQWTSTHPAPSARLDGSTSTRHIVDGVALKPGDEIRIEGVPDGREVAALDYLEIWPEGK